MEPFVEKEGLDIEETAAKKRKIDDNNIEVTKIVDEKRKKVKRKKKKRRKRKKFRPPTRKKKFVEKEYETEVDYLKEVLEEKKKEMDILKKSIEEKKEKNTKVSDEKLNNLTDKWKSACEDILRDLLSEWEKKLPDKKMMDILQSYRVPPSMVSYDEDEDEFSFFKSEY